MTFFHLRSHQKVGVARSMFKRKITRPEPGPLVILTGISQRLCGGFLLLFSGRSRSRRAVRAMLIY